ncbi:hypothetical protein BDQ17DRAFT_1435398 [Cyathus striatus]|nr:hypothetical protein BDQ17DRAFT_1435398 [Cyathus striatus]
MPQYNIVVSSLEEQTSKQQHLEMAATNTAPTVLPGDIGHYLEGMGELPNPFSIPATSTAEANDLPIPPVSSMENLDLAVKWGLLDKHGLNLSLGTCVTRSSHSKSVGISSSTAKLKSTSTINIHKTYSDVTQIDEHNNNINNISTTVEPVHTESVLVDKDGIVKIEIVDEYIIPKGFIKPKKTIKALKIIHKVLESIPQYFPHEFGNVDDEKKLKELNVIEQSAEHIKEFLGHSPSSPFDDIFQDIMGDCHIPYCLPPDAYALTLPLHCLLRTLVTF